MTPGTSDVASATRVRIDEAAHLPFVWKMTLGMRASKSPEVLALLTDGEAATMLNGKHAWGPVRFFCGLRTHECHASSERPSVRNATVFPPAGACPGTTANHPSPTQCWGVPRPHRQTPVTARETAAPIPNATAKAKARSHANATATPRPSIVAPLGLAPAIHGCRCSRDRRTRPIVVPSSFDQAAHLYATMIRRRRVMPSIAPCTPTWMRSFVTQWMRWA